jgi:radical SAM-linked protein
MHRMRLTFSTKGLLKYISHLDMMRLFERAARRASLPLKLTEGFNPHPKISITPAKPVGVESEGQDVDITLRMPVPLRDLVERLNRVLPPEIRITGAREVRKIKVGGKSQWV